MGIKTNNLLGKIIYIKVVFDNLKEFALDLDRSHRIKMKTTYPVLLEHLLDLSDDFSTVISFL